MTVRPLAAFAIGVLLVTASATGAAAEPTVTPGDGYVDTGIDEPGAPGGSDPGAGSGEGAQPVGSSGPPPCSYTVLTPQQAAALGLAAPDGDADNLARPGGSYYLRDCPSAGRRSVVWVPDGTPGEPPAGVPVVTPGELALQARNRLQLPAPAVAVNPDEVRGNPALVNLPTWWWVTNDGTLTQRTEAGPVWAEVTATPFATSWVDSRGAREDCASLGVAWEPWMQENHPGSCRFSYDFASLSETARVESVWKVTWVGSGGTSGELAPMRVATTHTLAVYERHAIRVG